MTDITRRDAVKIGAGGAIAAGLLPGSALGQGAPAWNIKPEPNASIRVLRPSKFVQGDETLWNENTKKFEAASGVKVRVDNESWEDLRPKSAVAANVGKGPDIVYGWYDDAHQYPEKLLDLTDLGNYLGQKYGGWYDIPKKYCTKGNRWISIPVGVAGGAITYRISMVKEAGFDGVPKDTAGFLKLMQALKAKGKPGGFAVGNAVGDGNGFAYWLLWAHGGKVVDANDNVTLNTPESIAALEYGKQLYETFVPGTLSWLDPSNNKAFLAGEISLTANGISIYYAAKTSTDPNTKALAADIGHAPMPIGPVGKPTEGGLIVPAMVYRYTKFPNAAKEYIRFMMEKEQYEPWQDACIGYWSHPLAYYEKAKVWTVDPKHTPFRDVGKRMLWMSYAGSLGYASAGVLADFIVVNMFASVCSGQKTPKEAAAEAQKRAERYYKI